MKGKPFLTLDEQINYLELNKNIQFDDKEEARRILKNNNYFNLISCAKVKFAIGLADDSHAYPETNFSEWNDYFELDKKTSKYLMNNIIDIERILNSRLSYHISKLIDGNQLTEVESNSIKQIIKSSRECKSYNLCETWKFISKMTLGEMINLLEWTQNQRMDTYTEITKEFSWVATKNPKLNMRRLRELNHLRNSLFHFRPLNIYLTYGKNTKQMKQYKLRKKVVTHVLVYRSNAEIRKALKEFHQSIEKFIKIKTVRPKSD